MQYTDNFNFKKPEGNDAITPDDFNYNSDIIDKRLYNSSKMEVAGGSSTNLTLINVTYENGDIKNFIYNFADGTPNTINDYPLYTNINDKEHPTMINGKAYTVWFDATEQCFFVKASAEGNAIASQVLAGNTFSNSKKTNIPGTMPNNGQINRSLNCGESFSVPLGYTSGGTVRANSLSSQTQGDADSSSIIQGRTAWVNGRKITGAATVYSLGGQYYCYEKRFQYNSPRFNLPSQDDRTNTTILNIDFEPSIIIGLSMSEADYTFFNGTENSYDYYNANGFYLKINDPNASFSRQLDYSTRTQIRSINYSNGQLTVYSKGGYGGTDLSYSFAVIAYK